MIVLRSASDELMGNLPIEPLDYTTARSSSSYDETVLKLPRSHDLGCN